MRPACLLLGVALGGRLVAGQAAPVRLNDTETVEYEQDIDEGWRWFVLPTNNTAAVSAGRHASARSSPATSAVEGAETESYAG